MTIPELVVCTTVEEQKKICVSPEEVIFYSEQ